MPLVSSGEISIGGSTSGRSINLEFGRAANATTSMSQLYRGGGIVTTNNTNVPTSGTISLSQFYGATRQFTYTISSNTINLNLRAGAIAAGWDGIAPLVVTINSGVYVSSNNTMTPALTVNGSFPGGVTLINNGFIVGMGGAGGNGAGQNGSTPIAGSAGSSGGPALSVSSAILIDNTGIIAGGGGGGGGGQVRFTLGGGGGGGGGGGRSSNAANSAAGAGGFGATARGSSGQPGTVHSAGGGGGGGAYGGNGGAGGGWGAAGSAGSVAVNAGGLGPYAGGAGGAAVSGNANITWINTGTRLGAII